MTEFIFSTLESIGFLHPLHPALTHIPMGMVMGCFFFGLAAIFFRNSIYLKTALHCSILGVLFIIPTVFTGYLDWQHTFGGTMDWPIKVKMVLAVVLTVLLLISIRMNLNGAKPTSLFVIYSLCLLSAVGLGFSGGELIFG